jgi:hypothetical protein
LAATARRSRCCAHGPHGYLIYLTAALFSVPGGDRMENPSPERLHAVRSESRDASCREAASPRSGLPGLVPGLRHSTSGPFFTEPL